MLKVKTIDYDLKKQLIEHYSFKWKKYDGSYIKNVSNYVKNWVNNNQFGDITIGCDSQEHARIKYSVTICMHYVDEFGIGHGAHVIFANYYDNDKNMKSDMYLKLFEEAQISVAAAFQLEDCGMNITIHLDFNSSETAADDPKKIAKSHGVIYNNGIGYVKGFGFEAFGKPFAWAATHVGDSLCKNRQAKGVS